MPCFSRVIQELIQLVLCGPRLLSCIFPLPFHHKHLQKQQLYYVFLPSGFILLSVSFIDICSRLILDVLYIGITACNTIESDLDTRGSSM